VEVGEGDLQRRLDRKLVQRGDVLVAHRLRRQHPRIDPHFGMHLGDVLRHPRSLDRIVRLTSDGLGDLVDQPKTLQDDRLAPGRRRRDGRMDSHRVVHRAGGADVSRRTSET
jgi:hypothetical protein